MVQQNHAMRAHGIAGALESSVCVFVYCNITGRQVMFELLKSSSAEVKEEKELESE